MKSTLFILSVLLGFIASAEVLQLRSDKGEAAAGELLRFEEDGKVTVKTAKNAKVFTMSLGFFDQASQKLLQDTWKNRQAELELGQKLNEIIGHPLFENGKSLFDEQASEVAARLRWPEESNTPYTSSYRRYTGSDYRFLGARPYSAVVYGREGGVAESLSLIFANKGDSLSTVGSGQDHFDDSREADTTEGKLARAMKKDAGKISETLTHLLGESTKQRFGEKTSRRTVQRWDWAGHSFLLTSLDGEYVGLQVVESAFADASGRTEHINDTVMKERLISNIQREPNGDVYLKNIPMVDQGPKGYCAPATFERAMRYAGVPADMYLLATLATDPGGGTLTHILFEEVKSICSSKARRARQEKIIKLKLRTIKRSIENGVPIMWSMRSLNLYNDIANKRTVERQSVENWDEYATRIADEAKENVIGLNFDGSHHLCLLIGYNEKTEEVAVSDSWGPRYKVRWVHIDEAAAVNNGRGYVIKR